ncbi:MAG: sodium:solute symporter, partial [Pseudomonadota bacterium]
MVGIFAAAMSSIDSALNSLSAATIEDYVSPRGGHSERRLFLYSKLATLGWGLFAVFFSYQVERIAPTVLEAINKIGSMANGPLLALFVLALVRPGVGQARAIGAFFTGLIGNAVIGLFVPTVSWLWWNVSGFVISIGVALILGGTRTAISSESINLPSRIATVSLLAMFGLIFVVCLLFTTISP